MGNDSHPRLASSAVSTDAAEGTIGTYRGAQRRNSSPIRSPIRQDPRLWRGIRSVDEGLVDDSLNMPPLRSVSGGGIGFLRDVFTLPGSVLSKTQLPSIPGARTSIDKDKDNDKDTTVDRIESGPKQGLSELQRRSSHTSLLRAFNFQPAQSIITAQRIRNSGLTQRRPYMSDAKLKQFMKGLSVESLDDAACQGAAELEVVKVINNTTAKISFVMVAVVILQLIFAVLFVESTWRMDLDDTTLSSGQQALKGLISALTLILLTLLFLYFRCRAALNYAVEKVYDRSSPWTLRLVLGMIFEMCICVIHIPPWWQPNVDDIIRSDGYSSYGTIDLIVALMFLRLYLIFRCLKHNNAFAMSNGARFIGILNHIKYNVMFSIKLLINSKPVATLIVLYISYVTVASYVLRICDKGVPDDAHAATRNYADAVWVTIITMMSIGYGDVVPQTYCGRGVGLISGLFGQIMTALIIAVVSQKLLLSQQESALLAYTARETKQQEYVRKAATVIQVGWRTSVRRRAGLRWQGYHEAKLARAIISFRDARRQLRDLIMTATAEGRELSYLEHLDESISEMGQDFHTLLMRLEGLQKGMSGGGQADGGVDHGLVMRQSSTSSDRSRRSGHSSQASAGIAENPGICAEDVALLMERVKAIESKVILLTTEGLENQLLQLENRLMDKVSELAQGQASRKSSTSNVQSVE
eukprot:Clim_evm83s128 gene=Clim_evmTU83s128